jgi:hypothetical protein
LTYQKDYRVVWDTFLRLKHNEKLEEDLWQWQHTLWSETCRQLIGCLLKQKCQRDFTWIEIAKSMAYIRREPMSGLWTDPPVAPGPFKVTGNKIDYIDLRDGVPDQRIGCWMCSLGCNQILLQRLPNGTEKIMAIWFLNLLNDNEPLEDVLASCHLGLEASLLHLIGNNSVSLAGLIVSSKATANGLPTQLLCSYGNNPSSVAMLCIQENYDLDLRSLYAQFDQIMNFFT